MARKTLSVLLMDPPYESNNTPTALRVIDAALRKGHNVNVFAYEGAVALTLKGQAPHPNPVKGTTVEQQQHPTPKDWIAALMKSVQGDQKIDWINCGLCVDERGAGDWIEGARRGSPADFAKMADASNQTLVIATR